MNPRPEFNTGDRNNSNGTSPVQQEAQPGVFKDAQPSSLDDNSAPLSGGERYEYGDSRPDRQDPGGFTSVDDHPMMTTDRDPEDFPEVRKEDPAFLDAHRVGDDDEIVAHYRKDDDSEEAIVTDFKARSYQAHETP